jgi:hypothetical protein
VGGLTMNKLFYCLNCKRIFAQEGECSYCSNTNIKGLVKNSPVNVIGSKLKGRVLKIDEKVRLLIIDENNTKIIREYEAEKLRKVL